MAQDISNSLAVLFDRFPESTTPTNGTIGPARKRDGVSEVETAIMGVKVKETNAENTMVTARVTANSRNSRPHDIRHEQQGNQHGDQRDGQRNDRESDLRRSTPMSASACIGDSPISI